MRASRSNVIPVARVRAAREVLFGPPTALSRGDLGLRPEPAFDRVEASARETPLVERFRRLVEFLGEGRDVSPDGGIGLADARLLVGVLGTTDVVDWRLGDTVFETRSAEQLPDVQATVVAAKQTGVVRIYRGRLVSTKKGRTIDRHAVELAFAAADVLMRAGPLQLRLGRHFGHLSHHWIDTRSMQVLCDIHGTGGSVSIDELVDDWRWRFEDVVDELLESVRDHLTEEQLESIELSWGDVEFDFELEQALDVFELFGLLRREGHVTKDDVVGLTLHEGGNMTLTPFGESFLWRAVERAEASAAVRDAARSGSSARISLAEECNVEIALESLVWVLRKDGSEALVETFMTVGPTRHQIEWCELVWRSPHEGTLDVLEGIARDHPDRTVSKAARKALFKRRSAGGRPS